MRKAWRFGWIHNKRISYDTDAKTKRDASLAGTQLFRLTHSPRITRMACAAAAIPKTEVTQTEDPNPAQLSPEGA